MTKHDEFEDGDFQSVSETAELWHLSAKTLWREVHAGALEVVRLGAAGRIIRTTRRTRAAYLAARRS